MRNPNEFYSQEEKEAMQEELADRESAEQLVKAQWPEAVCREFNICPGMWMVEAVKDAGLIRSSRLLGSGPTPEEAWLDAAERLAKNG